jgi:hypothetical protein
VRSLHFCEIAPRSSIIFLRPQSPLLSAARVISAAGRLPSPCRSASPLSFSTRRPTTPPTARAAPAGRPPLSHVGPPVLSGCHAPEGHAGAARRPEPGASSPPPLAPRPDLVQLPALLHRNCFNPELPHAGDARTPPHRRQPPSARPLAHLGTQVEPTQLTGARARFTYPCSSVLTGNAGTPTWPPPLLTAGRALPLPIEHNPLQPTPHVP